LKTKIGFGEYGSNTEIMSNTDLENMRFGDMLGFGDTLDFGNYIIGDVQGKKLDAALFAQAFRGPFISKTFCLFLLDFLLEQNSRQKCPISATIKSQPLGRK